MAGKQFDPEIRASMRGGGGGKPRPAQVRTQPGGPPKKPAPEPSSPAADLREDKQDVQAAQPMQPMQPPMGGGMPPDAHHVGAAAGIAHAILNRRPM